MDVPSKILNTSLSAEGTSTSSLSPSPATNGEVEVIETRAGAPPHPVETATLSDVELIGLQERQIPVAKNGDGATSIKAIKGYPIAQINVSSLRKFCGFNKIVDPVYRKSMHKQSKLALCIAIVAYKEDPQLLKTISKSKESTSNATLPVNRFRLANVVFSDI